MKTIFEKIIDGEMGADKVCESEHLLVIKDKFPKAPVHLLIITKKPIPNIEALHEEDFSLMGEVLRTAKALAKQFDLEKTGYRLLINNGPHAGQSIAHIHFHLLGGKPLGMMG